MEHKTEPARVTREAVSLSILIPVYNDWAAVSIVILSLARNFETRPDIRVGLLVVDDGSSEALPGDFAAICMGFAQASVLHLRFNLGHQRAIAIGLSWLGIRAPHDAVLVMDGDGEDTPEDAIRLVNHFLELDQNTAVFAARRRRTETRLFWLGYHSYRILHWMLTGIAVEIGNFSVLPAKSRAVLTFYPDLWSHYAAAALKAKIPMRRIPMDRGTRVAGRSKMNYVDLTRHGLSALSVFSSIVTARLLLAVAFAVGSVFAFVGGSWLVYAFTGFSLAAWNLQMIGIVLLFLVLCLVFSISIAFTAFADRSGFPRAPAHDYETHVKDEFTIR